MANESRARKRERWRTILEQWRESGSSRAAFCREHGIPAWQFQYWFRRLTEAEAGSEGAAFARVDCAGGTGVRLRLPSGAAIEVDRDFDPITLTRLLRAVGSQCRASRGEAGSTSTPVRRTCGNRSTDRAPWCTNTAAAWNRGCTTCS